MFKSTGFLLLGIVVCLVSSRSTAQDAPSKTQQLFDGKSLKGWSGDEHYWSVVDGVIVGRTTSEQPLSANTFLIWQGELGDFELTVKFKISSGNSGIQYRSQDLGEYHVAGYQADMDADHQYIGILYDERGRGILASRGEKVVIDADGQKSVVGKTGDIDKLMADLKKGEWNVYHIVARGNHLTQSLNGTVTVDVEDRDQKNAESHGILALQLHAGPPMQVEFKDIELKTFPNEAKDK